MNEIKRVDEYVKTSSHGKAMTKINLKEGEVCHGEPLRNKGIF